MRKNVQCHSPIILHVKAQGCLCLFAAEADSDREGGEEGREEGREEEEHEREEEDHKREQHKREASMATATSMKTERQASDHPGRLNTRRSR